MKFAIHQTDPNTAARTGILETDHGSIKTPVFMPVGTVGAVKTMAPHELEGVGSQIILGNTYHLYLRPGTNIIHKAGGLHKFSTWSRPILTDSGGFQVFSLARLRKITDDGVEFQSHLDGSRHMFTPEFSMKIQRNLGADIIMAFDECPPGDADDKTIRDAVDRTTRWMKRCTEWLKENPIFYDYEQTVFPIIQGTVNHELRAKSAEELIPFSICGMAIGGLAVGEEKNAMFDTVEFCDTVLPKDQPRYLMGVGKPSDLVKTIAMGVDMFDCVIPTRNGRNGQLFTRFGKINIRNTKYKDDVSLIDKNNQYHISQQYTKAYLHHLFKTREILGCRIATQHNLSFYNNLIKRAKIAINNGDFNKWSKKFIADYNQ